MKAMWNNVVIAESNDTEIVEGNHYFPFDSIKSEFFTKTELMIFIIELIIIYSLKANFPLFC